ncbi:MAG: aminotransferase class I/II-fold pyridoxal phosphate-dependent enzyme [Hyphomicrobiaceae bacterium]|nr:aminotransferase class I/II-fold pyridoxal phosphate-dependent enzyme [Hyphomicrobiaceae bacterium]
MSDYSGLQAMVRGEIISPFTRLRRLLEGIAPGHERPIEMTAGDPKEVMPGFVMDRMAEARHLLGTYPLTRGADDIRRTIGTWIERRYGLAGLVDPLRDVIVLNGSREGLFYAILPAVGRKSIPGKPVVLLPNPYYHAYLGSTSAVNAEPVFLDATEATGHLPDLDKLARMPDVLERTVAFYLCSPANPQGAVASPDYIRRALALARQYDFMLFFDECYSEIYTGEPPTGGLEIAARTPEKFKNIVCFNSLSKRSNLPGLRSGFVAGDPEFLETLAEVRNLTGPQMPGVIQQASIAVWSEEQHVAVIRQAYKAKFDICDEVLGTRFGYRRPAGGFFLWLDVSHLGGSVEATVTLWQRAGVKVVPGAYLAQPNRDGENPGDRYIRVALVHPPATIREALQRLVSL